MDFNDIPFELEHKRTYAPLSPVDLEQLGRRASNMYLCKEASLNDAVAKVASGYPGISPDQIKRVVEFANTITFQQLFEKQAGDKNIEFDLADPGTVIRDLNDGARPTTISAVPSEYAREPIKLGFRQVNADLALMQAFGFTPSTPTLSKMASATDALDLAARYMQAGRDVHGLVERDLHAAISLDAIRKQAEARGQYRASDPAGELIRARQQLVKQAELAHDAIARNHQMVKQAAAELTHEIRQEMLRGSNLGEIVHAMSQVAPAEWVKFAMERVTPDLLDHGFKAANLRAQLADYQITKQAAVRVINPNNRIVQLFDAFVKTGSNQRVMSENADKIEQLLGDVTVALQEAARRLS